MKRSILVCYLILTTITSSTCSSEITVGRNNDITTEVMLTLDSIRNVLQFMETYTTQLNLDALFAITLAKSQIEQAILKLDAGNAFQQPLRNFLTRSERLLNSYKEIAKLNPSRGEHDTLFQSILLTSKLWYHNVNFTTGLLDDLGLYSAWSVQDMNSRKTATVDGVSSDQCLSELLMENYEKHRTGGCYSGRKCSDMMLSNRNDTHYVLTHRLLFLQLARSINCKLNKNVFEKYVKKYCSEIWKEAKTNEYLGFPNRDLFLEQVVLCGIEGFEEFLVERWRLETITWQTIYGCYQSSLSDADDTKYRRTANVIQFGCVDHTTGLGLVSLSLSVRYLIATVESFV